MFGQLVLGIDERRPYVAPGQVTFRFLKASHKRKIDFALDEIRLGKHDALLNYACSDSFGVLHDRELTGCVYGYDPDGDAITAQLVSGPTNGTLTLNPDGTFTYTPNENYVGSDSFTYTWSDGLTTGSTASVTIDVYNNAPYAYDASFSVLHDRELVGQLYGYDPDGDAITAQLVSGPTNGSLTFHPDGTFTYTPNTHYVGPDSFTYTWSDGLTSGNAATVVIDVYNNTPYAYDASFSVLHDRELVGELYGYDPDGDPITAQLVSGPTNGTLTLNPDGTFTYNPNTHYVGPDSFTYTWSDGIAASEPATVRIEVYNNGPYAMEADYSVLHDRELRQQVAAYDPDGDNFWIARINDSVVEVGEEVSLPSGARVLILNNGEFVYTPHSRTVGGDSFTYTVSDGVAESLAATIRIYITNTPPVARDMTIHVPDQMPVTLSLICDDPGCGCEGAYDPDGDPLQVEIVAGPYQGQLESWGRYVVYTPNPDSSGQNRDWFYYRVRDGITASEIKRVELVRDQMVAEPPAGGPVVYMTGYRPKHNIFEETQVQPEQDGKVRVGVRWNNDDDDNDGIHDRWDNNVANENDLVKVVLDFKFGDQNRQPPPAGVVTYRLRVDNDNIRVWLYGPDKTPAATAVLGPIVAPGGGFAGALLENVVGFPVGADSGKMTIWVEWMRPPDQAAGGNKTVLTFEALVGGNVVSTYSIEFFGLQGMVFVFGGFAYDKPAWPIGKGDGMYQLGYELYKSGYDVYLFKHSDERAASAEAKVGVEKRGVQKLAALGYCVGGSSVLEFTTNISKWIKEQQLDENKIGVSFTAYVDAWSMDLLRKPIFIPLRQRPASKIHVNLYQQNSPDRVSIGLPTNKLSPDDNSTINIEVKDSGVTHNNIDDHPPVHDTIRQRLAEQGWK